MVEREETVGEAVARLLRAHGTDVVFGIPGVHTLELFRGINTHGLRHVLNRHEQGVLFAADGYARTSGKPGVAFVISGPGLTNAATPLAQAYHDSIPLLVVSAAVPTAQVGRGWGALHELPDQAAFMSTITAWSDHVAEPDALPAALARAFDLFGSRRPRPVHIEIPADVLASPAGELEAVQASPRRPSPAPGPVRAAADLLAHAERPFIVLGGGSVDAGDAVRDIADGLGAPVAMSLNAKGVVAEDHPLSLGTSLPTAAVLEAANAADAMLAVGTEFCEVDYYYAPGRLQPPANLVRVDIDPSQLSSQHRPRVAIHGDSAETLQALARALDSHGARSGDGAVRAAEIRTRIAWWEGSLHLMPAVEALAAVIPKDALVALDSTQLAYIGQNVWPAWKPRSWMAPAGFGTLGPGLPMAIGAWVAAPERPVLCIAGDGGFFYTMEELASAVDLGIPMPIVLWNNHGYGEIRVEMEEAGIDPIGTGAVAHDWCRIAEGFGCHAVRAKTLEALQAAVTDAFGRDRPTLIETGPVPGVGRD
jgi:thiamine pyrophosphate-dependent acetolactate synthase large subunit-like protein